MGARAQGQDSATVTVDVHTLRLLADMRQLGTGKMEIIIAEGRPVGALFEHFRQQY